MNKLAQQIRGSPFSSAQQIRLSPHLTEHTGIPHNVLTARRSSALMLSAQRCLVIATDNRLHFDAPVDFFFFSLCHHAFIFSLDVESHRARKSESSRVPAEKAQG